MKKIKFKKIFFLTTISLILVISFFVVISYSRADDDNEGDRQDFRQPVPAIQPPPVVTPQPVIVPPVIIPQQIDPATIPTPATTPAPAANEATTITKTIKQETVITVPDNSAVLAALKDSDKDGIPDVIDKYPGEDDFAYSLIDKNNNGIADDLERLLK